MNRFREWDERFEKKHPILYGLLTGVCGVGAFIAFMVWALVMWAVL